MECLIHKDCKKWIQDFMDKVNAVLFGRDEEHGILRRISNLEICVKQKVSKLWLIGTSLSVIAILCVIFLPTINAGVRALNNTQTTETRLLGQVAVNKEDIKDNKQVIKDQDLEWDRRLNEMETRIKDYFDLKIQILEERYIKKEEGG